MSDGTGRLDYRPIFRALLTVGGIGPREAGRLTLTQALAVLRDDQARRDPHAGGTVISSPADLRRLLDGI